MKARFCLCVALGKWGSAGRVQPAWGVEVWVGYILECGGQRKGRPMVGQAQGSGGVQIWHLRQILTPVPGHLTLQRPLGFLPMILLTQTQEALLGLVGLNHGKVKIPLIPRQCLDGSYMAPCNPAYPSSI